MKQIKYHHLRYAPDTDKKDGCPFDNMGGATLAYTFVEGIEDGTTELRIALSLCSLNDNFCRRKGREIAYHRLAGYPNKWTTRVELSDDEVVQVKFADVLKYAYEQWPNELGTWCIDEDADFELLAKRDQQSRPETRVDI